MSNAQELFVRKFGPIHDAEHQFVEGQQEMAQNAEQSAPEVLQKAM